MQTDTSGPPGLFAPLLDAVAVATDQDRRPLSFEEFIEPLLPDLIEASAAAQVARIRTDQDVCFRPHLTPDCLNRCTRAA